MLNLFQHPLVEKGKRKKELAESLMHNAKSIKKNILNHGLSVQRKIAFNEITVT